MKENNLHIFRAYRQDYLKKNWKVRSCNVLQPIGIPLGTHDFWIPNSLRMHNPNPNRYISLECLRTCLRTQLEGLCSSHPGYRQSLRFSWTTLRCKHCQCPITVHAFRTKIFYWRTVRNVCCSASENTPITSQCICPVCPIGHNIWDLMEKKALPCVRSRWKDPKRGIGILFQHQAQRKMAARAAKNENRVETSILSNNVHILMSTTFREILKTNAVDT